MSLTVRWEPDSPTELLAESFAMQSTLCLAQARASLAPGVVAVLKQLLQQGHFKRGESTSPGQQHLQPAVCPMDYGRRTFTISLKGEEWEGVPSTCRQSVLQAMVEEVGQAYLPGGELRLTPAADGSVRAEQVVRFTAAEGEQMLRMLKRWHPRAYKDPSLVCPGTDFQGRFFGETSKVVTSFVNMYSKRCPACPKPELDSEVFTTGWGVYTVMESINRLKADQGHLADSAFFPAMTVESFAAAMSKSRPNVAIMVPSKFTLLCGGSVMKFGRCTACCGCAPDWQHLVRKVQG